MEENRLVLWFSQVGEYMGHVWAAALLAICVMLPRPLFAWSLETHLYVGARVLEDLLPDGAISLCAGTAVPSNSIDCARQYPIPKAALDAIRQQPGAFLAGTLGPDVYPDFITGQVTTHPGVKGGWQTDDWLRHLLHVARSSHEIAWVYGYLSHASGDIFAHTWVNQYAGDIFDLGIHQEVGNEVEVRHFTLERYVADRTPRIWEAVGAWHAPHEFVADRLVLENSVVAQYKRSKIPSHLVAIEGVHENVSRVHDEALRLKSKIFEIGLRELSPLRAAEQALKDAERALQVAQEGLKAADGALATRDRLLREAEDKLIELARIIDENPALILGWRSQIEVQKVAAAAAEASFGALESAVRDARSVVDRLQNQLNGTMEKISKTVCKAVKKLICLGGIVPWCDDVIENVCETVTEINPAWLTINASLEAAKATLRGHEAALGAARDVASKARALILELDNKITQAERAITEAKLVQTATRLQIDVHRKQREIERKAVEQAQKVAAMAEAEVGRVRTKVAALQDKLQPVADLLARYDPLILFLAHWRDDIRRATAAFSETSEVVASRIVAKSSESRLKPYFEWYECWTPVLIAIPSEVPQTICVARAEFLAFKGRLEQELQDFVDRLGVLGWLLAPQVKLQQEFDKKVKKPLEKEVKKALNRARDEIIAFTTNRQLSELIRLMDSGERITDATLNGIYATDDSNSNLIQMGDVAQRVRADMGLANENAVVSENSFNALHNAIVLSKLALLDVTALNAVHRDLTGGASSVYGSTLYPEGSGAPFSLLLDAIRSIDGNHQWQVVALPYPRTGGVRDPGWREDRRYGRARPPGHSGFRYWGDRNSRESVFKRIFKGPLNPALESHPELSGRYPFPACAANPFPSTTDVHGELAPSDLTCNLIAESTATGLPGRYSVLSTRAVRSREIRALSAWDLRVARNEIFARRGFAFGPPELRAYFSSQPWYQPTDEETEVIARRLTGIEWRNIALIEALERRLPHGMPPMSADVVMSSR
ncbi:MAG: YARHG domain-containing protein [Rhodospirillales bacterium]|nr:YARHG domain-containing protein [Rhodospirillales bacterium]